MEKTNLIRKRYLCLLFIGMILAFGISSLPISSAASTVSVNTTGNDANNGTATNPYLTISTGINKVDNKGTVKLSKGTFNLNNGAGHTDYGITINKNLTIQGAGSSQTTIDAKGLGYIFTIKNSKVIIRDLTIKNGYALSGGAITNSLGSNLTLINCIITDNTATKSGGAIYNSGYLNVTASTLTNNKVTKGYGYDIYNHNGSADIHFNSIIGNNENSIYSDAGTVNAQNNWWGTNSNPGTELENFGDLKNWTPLWGATAKTVTINGDTGIQVSGANGTYPGIEKNVNYNFNGVAPNLQLWLYLDHGSGTFMLPTHVIEIGINLLTNDENKYFSTFLLQSQLQKGLNYVVIPLINAKGGDTWTSNGGMSWNDTITGVQLRIFYNPNLSANVTFLELKKNVQGIPKMVLTFDDGYSNIFNAAFPIMQKYGIKGTIYLNEGFVGLPGYLTLAQLHILYDAGWTIANHTPVHTDLSSLTSVAAVKATVQGGINWLLANGFKRGAYDLALPWGWYNDMVLQGLKESGVQTARTVMLRNTATPPDSLLQLTQEGPLGMNYPDGPNYTTLALAEDFVTNTIQSKTSTFVMMHQILSVPQTGSDWATADFANWIAYIAQNVTQNKIEMDTVDEWYDNLITEGTVNYGPWIVMNVTSNKNPLVISEASTITADFTHNSNGQDISSQGHIPNGIVTSFSSDSLGSVSPNSAVTTNGKATTTYTAGPNRGITTINVAANNQNSNLTLKINDPSIHISVVSTDPADGALNVLGNQTIIITFNSPIQADSAYNNIVARNTNDPNDTTTKPITTSISGDTLTITPTYNWLNLAKYSITIPFNSISDQSGSNLASDYTTSFTVG
jgi:predicted outer membrane repeat protein